MKAKSLNQTDERVWNDKNLGKFLSSLGLINGFISMSNFWGRSTWHFSDMNTVKFTSLFIDACIIRGFKVIFLVLLVLKVDLQC